MTDGLIQLLRNSVRHLNGIPVRAYHFFHRAEFADGLLCGTVSYRGEFGSLLAAKMKFGRIWIHGWVAQASLWKAEAKALRARWSFPRTASAV